MKRSTALADQPLGSAGGSTARICCTAHGLLDAASSAREPGLPTASPMSSIQKQRAFFMAEIHQCSVYSKPLLSGLSNSDFGKSIFRFGYLASRNAFVACNEV